MFLESIKLINREFQNLHFHQERINRTLFDHFKIKEPFDLKKELILPSQVHCGLYKCRVLYTHLVHKIEFHPYQEKEIKSFQLIVDDTIDYAYKYQDRAALKKLLSKKKKNVEEILIVKNGLITDSSYSNVVFFDGKNWFTPDQPLLAGTQRANLLTNKKIKKRKIRPEDLDQFIGLKLINAMMSLEDSELILIEQVIQDF